jgi:hypothetical protein
MQDLFQIEYFTQNVLFIETYSLLRYHDVRVGAEGSTSLRSQLPLLTLFWTCNTSYPWVIALL